MYSIKMCRTRKKNVLKTGLVSTGLIPNIFVLRLIHTSIVLLDGYSRPTVSLLWGGDREAAVQSASSEGRQRGCSTVIRLWGATERLQYSKPPLGGDREAAVQ